MVQASLDMKVEKITSNNIIEALDRKYKTENYLKLTEFDEYASGRRIDFMAMSLVRSRPGIHGIEIKISRSDWQRELNNPKKADAFYFCDYYYLASPPDVWHNGEVPQAWGILEYDSKKKKLKVIREPTKLDVRYDFMFLKTFVGRIMRPEISTLAKIRDEAYQEGYKEGKKSQYASLDVSNIKRQLQMYEENFERFKTESGIDIFSTWDLGKIGEIVKRVQDTDDANRKLDRFRDNLDDLISHLQETKNKLGDKTGNE